MSSLLLANIRSLVSKLDQLQVLGIGAQFVRYAYNVKHIPHTHKDWLVQNTVFIVFLEFFPRDRWNATRMN